jgi:hypothetical protein
MISAWTTKKPTATSISLRKQASGKALQYVLGRIKWPRPDASEIHAASLHFEY